MGHIDILRGDLALDAPTMIEGFPGAGLVGKIATDHLVETCEMVHYANVHCDALPPVTVYAADDPELATPVRLYADAERDLVALQSDIPVSPDAALEFASCIAKWYDEHGVTPIYLSGLARDESGDEPALYGVAAGDGAGLLDAAGVSRPTETGLVSGPTGALLSDAVEHGRTAVCLIVETDPQFPDPASARVLLTDGLAPLTDIDVPTQALVDHATEIREAKQQLAERMSQATEESSKAQPLRMYQ
jgi:uncharacterized protein